MIKLGPESKSPVLLNSTLKYVIFDRDIRDYISTSVSKN